MTLHNSSTLAVKALLLLAALGTTYLLLTDSVNRRAARCRFDEAMEAFQYEEPIRAIQLLLEAERLDPDCADYHASLALAYSTDRYAAASLMGLSLPELYSEILKETAMASSLCPECVESAKIYAYWMLDAGQFNARIDWDLAYEAWCDYRKALENDARDRSRHPATHAATLYGILVRLSKIEHQRGNLDSADAYMAETCIMRITAKERGYSMCVRDYLKEAGLAVGEPTFVARSEYVK